jgi:hypothetical protein
MKISRRWLLIVVGMLICCGCAGRGSNLREDSPPPTERDQKLSAGIKSYEQGNYNESAKLIQEALTKGLPDKESQVEAHKYLAFIHCVSGRKKECADEFKKALAVDPNFELQAAEVGHPLWGPVYSSVKITKVTPAEITAQPSKPEAPPPPSVLAPKEAQAAEPASQPVPSAQILVVTKTANVREKPDGKSKIISIVKKGEKIENIGKSKTGNWINCKLPSGVTGWIFKDLVQAVR